MEAHANEHGLRLVKLYIDDAGYYRYLFRTHCVGVHYVNENFNSYSTDDLLRLVKQRQARQEAKALSKVTIRGLLSTCNTGCWMGGSHGVNWLNLKMVDIHAATAKQQVNRG